MTQLYPCSLLAICIAGAATAQTPDGVKVIEGFAAPESVLIGPEERYVSNIGTGSDPMGKDGDGFISVLDADGRVTEMKAFTGLDAPKGMALSGNTLYVADVDRVVGFDVTTREQVSVAQMECAGPCLLNDMDVGEDQLLVTETLHGTLHGLDPSTGTFTVLADGIGGANGVTWDADNDRAIIVAFGAELAGGQVSTWSPSEGHQAIPNSPTGLFDGVALLPDGRVVISQWMAMEPEPGATLTVDLATGEHETIDFGIPIISPADHGLDDAGKLWIPAMMSGTVVVAPLP